MSRIVSWLSRLWSRGSSAATKADDPPSPPHPARPIVIPPPGQGSRAATPPETGAAPESPAQSETRLLLPWLLGCPAPTDAPITPAEQQAFNALDETLALSELPETLLPRAAALIPQMIALVRQTDLPTPAIAKQVSRDAQLAAELMRLASSPYYRAQGDVTNMEQAINLIGLQGLQTVIARVLLKPIYQASPGGLSALAAPRLWEYSEALSRHAASLAEPADQPVFDAYLAGLLHGTGWTVALRVLDRAGIVLDLPPSEPFALRMAESVHRLFGLAAQRWEITLGFVAFAQDARRNGIAASTHPMMPVLQWAQQRSMDELASP